MCRGLKTYPITRNHNHSRTSEFVLGAFIRLHFLKVLHWTRNYSAKGVADLIGIVRQGIFRPADIVLFLHTGRSAALFADEGILLKKEI